MKATKLNRVIKSSLLSAPFIGLSLLPSQVLAGSQVADLSRDTCTTINCNAAVTSGTYHYGPFENSNPFILQIYAEPNECLRVDVTSQNADLEAVLVSPEGTVWRNDDRIIQTDLRPLIKVTPNVKGWYTLQISKYNGVAPYAIFTVEHGRYNQGNPNCAGGITPSLTGVSGLRAKP